MVDNKKKFPDLINKAAGKVKKASGEPFILSMLGIIIVAKSRPGKAIFLSIVPAVIGSATLALDSWVDWASDVFCHMIEVREVFGMSPC